MTFISVLAALLIERFSDSLRVFRQQDHLRNYLEWMGRRLRPRAVFDSWLGVAVMLLPLVIVIHWVYGFFDGWLFGLVGVAMAVAILLFSLGPKDIDIELTEYIEADNETARRAIYLDITREGSMPHDPGRRKQVLCQAAFIEANRRLFAVLFWFAAAGPMAALLYRLSKELAHAEHFHDSGLQQVAMQWLGLLNWIPARLLVMTMALTGSFESLWAILRRHFLCNPAFCYETNAKMLAEAGAIAVPVPSAGEGQPDGGELQTCQRVNTILQRNLVVWVILLALITLAGWV